MKTLHQLSKKWTAGEQPGGGEWCSTWAGEAKGSAAESCQADMVMETRGCAGRAASIHRAQTDARSARGGYGEQMHSWPLPRLVYGNEDA